MKQLTVPASALQTGDVIKLSGGSTAVVCAPLDDDGYLKMQMRTHAGLGGIIALRVVDNYKKFTILEEEYEILSNKKR
jgi:hypothetical protein